MRRPPCIALGVAAIALAAPQAASAAGLYVALGDSYTAGPLIPMQVGTPADCARSDHNYPSLTAEAFGLALRDVSCSGATTKHMANPQSGLPAGGTNPPQFNGVTPDAAVVTVGIGGNDAGLVSVGAKCGELGATNPTGHACRDFYTAGGRDQVKEKIDAAAPKIAAVLQGIHTRAPDARVAIVGYPAVVPTDGTGCYPTVPLSPDDIAYFNELLVKINAMIAGQARANDAEYVDTYTPSIGHDVCTLPLTRWFEGLAPTEPAFPLHPNGRGEASLARSTIAVLSRPRPPRAARPPVVSGLGQARTARRVGPPPRFTFTLDRAATATISLQRRVADKRYGPVRAVAVRALPAGPARVSVKRATLGRLRGAYKLTVTPAAAGVTGAPIALRFRVR
jgi:hypothetical protein